MVHKVKGGKKAFLLLFLCVGGDKHYYKRVRKWLKFYF